MAYSYISYSASHRGLSKVVYEIKLATASIVGWSNTIVYENSVANLSVRVLANSVAEIESIPEAMSSEFAATKVPNASQMIVDNLEII